MHPNPVFRAEDQTRALALARARGFGILTLSTDAGVLASHVPFIVEGEIVAAHLVRSNPMVPVLKANPTEALLIVSGPDAYISPDWYGVEDQVPTWNYVAVHLRGSLRLIEQDRLQPHLEALSAHQEMQLSPKTPWHHAKMTPGVMERMMRQIVPVEMSISQVDATWKLNQNKTQEARLSAAAALEAQGHTAPNAEIAGLMRDLGGS